MMEFVSILTQILAIFILSHIKFLDFSPTKFAIYKKDLLQFSWKKNTLFCKYYYVE